MDNESGYIPAEIWKARPSWLALSLEERQQLFQEIGPLIMGLLEQDPEFLSCAINDNTGSERMDYQYMARLEAARQGFQ